ncbi:GAF domain-containing protein [Friedmanniella luteola]|uniref:GAF domain-containing protein n=1 Tax=Friedmanniella luteola TaxID=546871 RepID=A0A1H1ZGN6_9ACTN|nr:GAF and ANTAR domain-containing protein [Friedmanniella luteola]SDT32727.1 GAF domain-containing protein [Friedmanniella luteola]
MTAQTLAEAYADAARRLAGRTDVLGNVVALLVDAAALLGGQAAGLLVRRPDNTLELVASTSHRPAELDLYQRQQRWGPCVQAVRTGRVVVAGAHELGERWNGIGVAVLDAGFCRLEAFPVFWHDDVLGALTVLHAEDRPLDPDAEETGATFATMASLALARPAEQSTSSVEQLVLQALESRVVVEQAKGVLAYDWGVDTPAAYALLVRAASDQDRPLTEVAARIVADASRRDRDLGG